MFLRYLGKYDARDKYSESQKLYREKRIQVAKARITELTAQIDRLRAEIASEEAGTAQIEPLRPTERLINCAAFLYDAASCQLKPTYSEAVRLGYFVTGAALASALNDALALGWIGKTKDGALYWRDAGLSEECPLVVLAKMHPKFAGK